MKQKCIHCKSDNCIHGQPETDKFGNIVVQIICIPCNLIYLLIRAMWHKKQPTDES